MVGEVLFDCFADGSRVLGGAPFNLAWHLHAMAAAPLLITRVGADQEGAEIVAAMNRWELDTAGVQSDDRHATGTVEVRLEGTEPIFAVPPDQAWDHLDAALALAAVAGAQLRLLCHGSLVARAAPSRATVTAVRAASALPVFVDVNLRTPFWTVHGVLELLAGVRWVKLNEAELAALAPPASTLEAAASGLRERLGAEQVWVTRGAAGAFVVTADGVIAGRHPAEVAVVDTVGVGDAFSAVVVAGLLWGWSPRRTLTAALAFAARVCELRGATSSDRSLYAGLGLAALG